ncbi:MAG: hypothetical protein II954_11505 [Synergistaceae bacterium]|nr:hypothetical protein [Synergistaceae bacterium]
MFTSAREFLARKLTGHVQVHTLDEAFITELVPVHTVRRSVETHTVRPEFTVSVRTIELGAKRKCRVNGFKLKDKTVRTNGFRPKRYTKHDVKVHGLPKRRKINVWSGLKKIQSLPVELENKLKFLKDKPAVSKNEVILAYYSPIVDSAVIKLALDKRRGTLLVWYNPGSRQYKARSVFLIRRLGLGEKPEWRWV